MKVQIQYVMAGLNPKAVHYGIPKTDGTHRLACGTKVQHVWIVGKSALSDGFEMCEKCAAARRAAGK
jgi:hypothetical protein